MLQVAGGRRREGGRKEEGRRKEGERNCHRRLVISREWW